MDSFEDEEDKDSNSVLSATETVSFNDWQQKLYDRDQSKDDDMMSELADELEDGDGGRENRTNKKLNKQVIIYELKCPQTDCNLSLKSLEQLHQHQETVHGIMAYNCLVTGCSEQYNNRAVIGLHYSTVHSNNTNWTCPHCDSIRNNSTSLRNHIRHSHQFGRFGCWYDGCSFEADLRIKVQRHRYKAHPRLTCSINGCGKGFYYESQLKQHQSYHSKLSENQVDEMIDEIDLNQSDSSEPSTSIRVDSKKRPKKKSHSKPEKRQKMDVDDEVTNSKVILLGVKCPQSECDMMLGTMSELRQHKESVHGVLKYQCLITGCSEQFHNSIKISHHYSTVHPHQNWVCSKCDIKFGNQCKLQFHIRDFHQYGYFQCGYSECTFEADLRSKVRNHYVRAHARYSCPIDGCDFVAYYESSLNQHQQTLHAAIREESSQNDLNQTERTTSGEVDSKKQTKKTSHPKVTKRPKLSDDDGNDEKVNKKIIILELKCPQSECNLALNSFCQLLQHQQDAHGVLQFPCLVSGCSEQYNSSRKIGHHYSTVHPHQSWVCSKCDIIFVNQSKLRAHIREFHLYGHFQCGYAECSFEADLRSKVRNHYISAHARYSCPIDGCDFVAYYESDLKKHQQTLHATVREVSSPTLSEPITSVEVVSKKRAKTPSNPKVTKQPKMNDYVDVDDEIVKKKIVILELKCPQSECNIILSSYSQLCQHQQDAHGVLAFSCLVAGCSEQFSNRRKIGNHYSTVHPHHTDWTCPQCNVKMKNATLLRRHIRDYHQFGQFHCAHLVCTFEADLWSKVQKHMKNMHN